ncbi:general transcription factor IIA, 1, 19/37kDa-like, partial [Scleropages formosus]
MASSANSNPVPKLYRSVIEDVINDVRELFLDEGVDEQVLQELKTLWENKLMQSKAVEGFHTEEQALQQQLQQQLAPQAQTQSQPSQVLLPPAQQAPQQQVIVQDPKLLQHMTVTGMSAAASAATIALPTGVTPYQQLLTSQGQILQVVRGPNGAQYLIQPQQQVVLQSQVLPQMQPGGVQAPVIQQVLTPLQGGIPQQTGVIIQPQQIVLAGNKVQPNPQVMQTPAVTAQAGQGTAQMQQQAQAQQQQSPQQPQQQPPPVMLQVDGAGDTSSEEDDEEEDEYDEDEDDDKDKDGGEDGQVEEIHRSKNKWKFHLKDGIMNLNGRDYVFSKAIGDAE